MACQHRVQWFVYAGGERIPRQASMRGTWGYDAVCECGWDSRTGGGVRSYVEELIREHRRDAAQDEVQDEAQRSGVLADGTMVRFVAGAYRGFAGLVEAPAGDPYVHVRIPSVATVGPIWPSEFPTMLEVL